MPFIGAMTVQIILRLRPAALFGGLWLLGAMAPPAAAQTPSPLAEWQYSAGNLLETMFEPEQPDWRGEIGPALSFGPLYDGATRQTVTPGVTAELRYRDLAFASTGEGIGVNLLRGENYRAGLALTYDLGRREADDRSRLRGMGNVAMAPELKLFGEYAVSKAFPLVMRVDIRRTAGGSNGTIGDLGAYLPLPGSSETLFLFAGPTLTLADATYMQSYFGVTPLQASRSAYRAYTPAGGIKSAGIGLGATWFFSQSWFLDADLAVSRLLGAAAASPVVRAPLATTLAATVAYRF